MKACETPAKPEKSEDLFMFAASEPTEEEITAVKKKAMAPIEHRAVLTKVSSALNHLSEASAPAKPKDDGDKDGEDGGKGTKANEDDDKDKSGGGGATVGIILGVVGVLGALGGTYYCYRTKKCCFKGDESNEGGQSERKIYKKQVKSANAHKRHTKEALMPEFKVADEQA